MTESDNTGSAPYLNESDGGVDKIGESVDRANSPALPRGEFLAPNLAVTLAGSSTAGESPTSGYQLSVELSREEGDHLLERLMETVAEEEMEEMPRLEDHRSSEE